MISGFSKVIRRWSILLAGIESVEDHFFLPRLLSPSSRVVDAGANCGRFSRRIAEKFGCEVIAVEPESSNCAAIGHHPHIQIFGCALAGGSGKISLALSHDSSAHRAVSNSVCAGAGATIMVPCTTLSELLDQNGWSDRIDLLKMDIEGMEWEVFASTSDDQLRRCSQVTVEFHDFAGLAPYSNATWEIYRRMRRLGFFEVEDPVAGPYNVLFIRKGAGLSPREYLALTSLSVIVWLGRKASGLSRRFMSPV